MNLLNYTKQFCKENNIKPSRSKGQNFLVNENIYEKIIETADLKKTDTVLEVGPGLGFLTEKLARVAKAVLAVELDDLLYGLLVKKLKAEGIKNVQVLNQNILDARIEDTKCPIGHLVSDRKYKIVANLPYNITSVFLRKFLSAENKPGEMVLMLQKEVADRIVAQAGKMSLLAISVQFYAEAELVFPVSREDFWPMPAVDSAIIKLRIKNEELRMKNISEKKFFQLVKFGFSSKRKMLKNNLTAGFRLSQDEVIEKIKKAGFAEKTRAQELSVGDWQKLLTYF